MHIIIPFAAINLHSSQSWVWPQEAARPCTAHFVRAKEIRGGQIPPPAPEPLLGGQAPARQNHIQSSLGTWWFSFWGANFQLLFVWVCESSSYGANVTSFSERDQWRFCFWLWWEQPRGNWGAFPGDHCSWLRLNADCSLDKPWCSRLIRLISLSAWKDLVYSHLTICYEAFSPSTVKQIQMLENCTVHESSEYGENNCHFPKMQQSKMLYISIQD